jgi:hypothetical protein
MSLPMCCGVQISVKSSVDLRSSLSRSAFKHSINTYWVTSKESPELMWSEELAPSSAEVEKFRMRDHDGCDVTSFFTFSDCFENFLDQYEAKVSMALAGGEEIVHGHDQGRG